MKFTVEVEIGWLGDDGSLDEEVEQRMLASVVERVSKQVEGRLNDLVSKQLDSIIDSRCNEMITSWLDREIQVTDRWGDKQSEGTIEEILRAKFDSFWEQKVDKNGSGNSGYGDKTTRLEWLLKKHVTDYAGTWSKKLSEDIEKQVRAMLSDKLKASIGGGIIDQLGVPQLMERIEREAK